VLNLHKRQEGPLRLPGVILITKVILTKSTTHESCGELLYLPEDGELPYLLDEGKLLFLLEDGEPPYPLDEGELPYLLEHGEITYLPLPRENMVKDIILNIQTIREKDVRLLPHQDEQRMLFCLTSYRGFSLKSPPEKITTVPFCKQRV
jgi:hypothetical protein